jgi:hypothetical protein
MDCYEVGRGYTGEGGGGEWKDGKDGSDEEGVEGETRGVQHRKEVCKNRGTAQ